MISLGPRYSTTEREKKGKIDGLHWQGTYY